MNIIEQHFTIEKNLDQEKCDQLIAYMRITPGILHSKFAWQEGYVAITMDTDLCTQDEIIEAILSKTKDRVKSKPLKEGFKIPQCLKKLFPR